MPSNSLAVFLALLAATSAAAQPMNRISVVAEKAAITAPAIRFFEDDIPVHDFTVNPVGCRPAEFAMRTEVEPPAGAVAVLFDSIHFLRGGLPVAAEAMKAEARKWLRSLSPEMPVAVYSSDLHFHVLKEFAQPVQKLEAGLTIFDKRPILSGQATKTEIHVGGVTDMELASLEAIANHMGNLPGRKALVWSCAEVSMPKVETAPHYDLWASAVRTLANANVAVYTVDCIESSEKLGERLANATGGRAYFGYGQLERIVEDALRDNRCSYEVTWPRRQSNSPTRALHAIRIEPTVKGLRLLYPNRYFESELPQDDAARLIATERALIYPLEARGIVLSVATERLAEGLQATIQFSPRRIVLSGGPVHRGLADVIWAWYDASGERIKAGRRDQVKFEIQESRLEEFLRTDHAITQTLTVPPGAVELRVAVRDARSGTLGSRTIAVGTRASLP